MPIFFTVNADSQWGAGMLELTEALYLGRGKHKKTYIHPEDEGKCVKIQLAEDDGMDLKHELAYRQALGSKAEDMPLLTCYYGEEETSEGHGYVFERVRDYDGSSSHTLKELLQACRTEADGERLLPLLQDFGREFLRERFCAGGMDPNNFLVQRQDSRSSRVRVIDNIGTSATIPLTYYVDFLARRRAERYWRHFVEGLRRGYGQAFTERLLGQLL